MSVVIVIVLGLKVALFARNSYRYMGLIGRPPSGNSGLVQCEWLVKNYAGVFQALYCLVTAWSACFAYIEHSQSFWIFCIISYRTVHRLGILPELCIDIYWKCFGELCWGFCRIWENLERIRCVFGWVLLWFISWSKTLDIDVLSFSDLY